MPKRRVEQIARQYPENGVKLLLQNPLNVHDLLAVGEAERIELIDFERLRVVPTTFVLRDYRHIESDVVLRAPLRGPQDSPPRRNIFIYILIEHQSQPDPLM